jgi:hypothetical protein
MVLGGCELPMQLVGANIRRILISHAAGVECCIGYCNHVLAGFCFALSDGKRVLTGEGFCLKAYELDDDIFAHGCLGPISLTPKKKADRSVPVRLLLQLEAGDVRCLQSLGTTGHFEFNRLAFVQRLVSLRLNRGEMNENILAGLALNESESLAGIEPLYCSLFSH